MLQFLLEAVTLTVAGGAIGIIGGGFLGWLLTRFAAKALGELTYVISIPAILAALLMAVTTGLIFGLYPARRASRLDPIEALRFE
jgi:ABC-type antimicrobial peptide transport system permease subunit